jgi:hypothetical protein
MRGRAAVQVVVNSLARQAREHADKGKREHEAVGDTVADGKQRLGVRGGESDRPCVYGASHVARQGSGEQGQAAAAPPARAKLKSILV